MNLTVLLRTECRKLRRSGILLLLLLPVVILWFPMVWNGDISLTAAGYTPAVNFMIQAFLGISCFMFPASLVIVTVLLTQTERAGRGRIKMLSLPVSPALWCLAKFLVLLLLAAVELIFMTVGWWISAIAVSRLCGQDFMLPLSLVVREAGCLYLASLPMAAVYWMLAVCCAEPVISVGLGFASIVPSVLIMNTKVWVAYPMCYGFRVMTMELSRLAIESEAVDYQLGLWVPVAAAITAAALAVACVRMRRP